MGRWAEVYFTTPPEKREQAVSELLRELRHGAPSEPASVQVISPVLNPTINDQNGEQKPAAKGEDGEDEETPDSSASGEESLRICGACAHANSAGQRFCGMCGALLQMLAEPHVQHVPEAAPISAGHGSEPGSPGGGELSEYAIEPEFRNTGAGGHDVLNPARTLPERNLLHFDLEPETAPNRFRVYAGLLLAILLALLLYMAWRGTKAISDATGKQSAAARAIPSAPAAASEPAASEQSNTTHSVSPEGNLDASPVQSEKPPTAISRKNKPEGAPPAAPAAEKSSVAAAEQSGAEELATAEKFLNGAQGLPRDHKEGAQWLWKAVGKGNLAATVALSDLYLRGDGVPKSCDQARLLLDAAARKGGAAAADRLRHLQAFGCD